MHERAARLAGLVTSPNRRFSYLEFPPDPYLETRAHLHALAYVVDDDSRVCASWCIKKIVVVEDDQNIAKALAARLKSAGYELIISLGALSGVSNAVKDPAGSCPARYFVAGRRPKRRMGRTCLGSPFAARTAQR